MLIDDKRDGVAPHSDLLKVRVKTKLVKASELGKNEFYCYPVPYGK